MTIVEQAKELRSALDKLAENATDAVASAAVIAYPKMKQNGELIKAGTRINWNGTIKRASVDLWDTENNNPDNAPDLWEDIAYIKGVRIIPETITASLAFKMDELGWWEGKVYRSLRDGNTFTPAVTPEWWEVVE